MGGVVIDFTNFSAVQLGQLISMERLPILIAFVVGGWALLTFGSRAIDRVAERFTERRLMLMKTKALTRFSVYVLLILGVPLLLLSSAGRQAMIPALATLGLGLGFALKDVAASLIAGVTLIVDEPFQVGDRIAFGPYYGEVKIIGLRSVRLETLDDNLVTIPNNAFMVDMVASANAGALDCMVVIPFHIGLDEDASRARRLLEEVAATSCYVYLDKPVVTVVHEVIVGMRFATLVQLKAYVFDARFEKAFLTDVTMRGRTSLRGAAIRSPDEVPLALGAGSATPEPA